MIRHYFFRGQHVGTSTVEKRFVHSELQPPTGKAFFCPFCAEVWAAGVISDRQTYPVLIPCDRHEPTITQLAGSLWLPFDSDWNESLPPELLAREFLLQLDYKEKYGI